VLTITPESPERRAARARYQDDLAAAEEHYAAALRSLNEPHAHVEQRATHHRDRAARIRRGVE
jgi:hypothetical protein